jgi:hypothetical protein
MREQWREFKHWPPGQRFVLFHEAQRTRLSKWQRALLLIGTLVSLAVGVVLVFMPGPAVVFFGLAAALLAAQSVWIARRLDAFERWLRRVRDPDRHVRGRGRTAR